MKLGVSALLPTSAKWSIFDDKEVNDPGSEVQSNVCFIVDDSNAVSVPKACPGHAATEEEEWRPIKMNTHQE